jgi:alkylated DNA repair dioxygenase AlkB
VLAAVRGRVEQLCGARFNTVLLNLYRDGRDSMSWHSDDEPELGDAPLIASLSLGATRRLLLRTRSVPRQRIGLELEAGSLLLMEPPLQAHWQHAVPKTRRACGPRLNLTFRWVLPRGGGLY